MFDKIAIINDKIQFLKYTVTWTETVVKNFDKETKQPIFDKKEKTYCAYSEADKECLIERLSKKQIQYTVILETTPAEYLKFEGAVWTKSRDEAVLYINNAPIYEIENLKKQLSDMDYKTSKYADGDYTQEQWAEIVAERKALRQRIRELEEK